MDFRNCEHLFEILDALGVKRWDGKAEYENIRDTASDLLFWVIGSRNGVAGVDETIRLLTDKIQAQAADYQKIS